MPNVDQFESVFKAAAKAPFHYEPPRLETIALISDLDAAAAERVCGRVRAFLEVLGEQPRWRVFQAPASRTVEQLLGLIEGEEPDLVVTWRNLHSDAWRWPHSLGRHLDVLTQATHCPVLVIPHPADEVVFDRAMQHTRAVMVVTDHLVGDGRLVSVAAALTEPGGTLVLAHVEDDSTFERYIGVIAKIPTIDTDNARETILAQLLKEPRDYVEACRLELEGKGGGLRVTAEVLTGHRVSEYRALVERNGVELLVMHTKDEDQLAMHGLAYPLAVELRHLPLLMV